MKKVSKQGLVFYQSEILLRAGVENYFLTRLGGFSQGPFSELNLSFRVGDDPATVKKNYQKVKDTLGIKFLATVHQVHGNRVLDIDLEPFDEDGLRAIEADGIITAQKDIAAGVLVADCFPLLLFEAEKKILAVAHCGWRGIVGKMIENALQAIAEKGGESRSVLAALGPGVCAKCYEVDEKVIAEFAGRFPRGEGKIWKQGTKGYQLDLKAAVFSILNRLGVEQDRTDDLGLCTCCNPEFFSHRRDQGRSGRQLAMAMIK
jgi:polyphenol oxidase